MTQHPPVDTTWILPFSSSEAAAEETGVFIVGGKGANLARLAQAGFPVPGGFLVATYAYREFVAANFLEGEILAALPGDWSDLAALEQASARIRALFAAGRMPAVLEEQMLAAYRELGVDPPVAVRSSATAEDLPGMSFAGQQDTYLNIVGGDSLLKAVIDCWSSLWTARAIGYRARNQVSQSGPALAVVVQHMVESQASGVMFTANPLTGLRTETVVDATFGLGEALVSGKVEPDHYVVDAAQGRILSKTLGAKALSIHGQGGGGTMELALERKEHQALPDWQILGLARMGQQVAALYRFPQDIEWAWANDTLYLLQSRPITSLFPTPAGLPAEPLKALVSFAAIQGLFDPITPLGRDTLGAIFAMGQSLFGIRSTSETQTVLLTAGERLWVNFTPLLVNSVGRRATRVALDMIEPTVQQAMGSLWEDPRLQPGKPGISLHALGRMARFFVPLAGNVILNLIAPRARREMIINHGERLLEQACARCDALTGDRWARLERLADLLPNLIQKDLPSTFTLFVSAVAAGMASFNLLRVLANQVTAPGENHGSGVHWSDLVLEITRGLPHNPTTEMDLLLWDVAQAIRRDPASLAAFRASSPAELAARYKSGDLPALAAKVVARFIERYGVRGLGEIDLGRTRWFEDPTHIFEALSGYLQIEGGEQAPDAVFARGADAAQAAVDRLAAALRRSPRGWFKARLARFMASRVRELLGARESPKFFAVRMFGLLRRELLEVGQDFAQSGDLERPDDLFYLTFAELRAFARRRTALNSAAAGSAAAGNVAGNVAGNAAASAASTLTGSPAGAGASTALTWRELIAQRREANRREAQRRQVPRLLLSDGRAFYEGLRPAVEGDGSLTGSPVSPGSVEGTVRVVLDPRQAGLLPGEILVCPGTDPSWTPLFLTAGGLVMEVGGMMTHGAVVAREYGIPAVVGVDQATRRLHTGQRIRVDGSTGQIEILG